jgi:hypothetical protein
LINEASKEACYIQDGVYSFPRIALKQICKVHGSFLRNFLKRDGFGAIWSIYGLDGIDFLPSICKVIEKFGIFIIDLQPKGSTLQSPFLFFI